MSTAALDTDVLVVGAGPVGLFLANECARRGLKYRIIEAHSSQSLHSKALAIFPRTLEILDMAGLAAPFVEAANRVTSVAVLTHGRALAQIPFAPEQTPYPFIAMVPQNLTERLLLEQLQRAGGAVEYQTSLVSAIDQGDCVVATLEHDGKPVKVRASFLVGCDGAHSAVRHLLGLAFEGHEYDASFMLADVESNDVLPADQLQLCPHESGPLAIFPMSANRRRIVAIVERPAAEAPSLDLVRSLLAERAPAGTEARALHWSSYFRVHHRQVGRLRVGRMFIAGDSAHIHSPFGGQGMNTGMHDAWNLVWKLDLALRGQAQESLLDSYTAERRPQIKQVIRTTDLLTKAMGTPNRLAQALRDVLIPVVSRLAPFQHAFVARMSGLAIAYPRSPIVEGAGARYFDDSIRGGKGIGSRYLLVSGCEGDAMSEQAVRQFANALGGIVQLRCVPGRRTVLIRPDGFLAYDARTRGVTESLARIAAILARQVKLPATDARQDWMPKTSRAAH